ncbi:hypothetical protein EHQ53_15115 [Leptospira langatensis]|uniref:Uncharacterized protein n=1 Tax=Leptospira langatensis TaxID=2484983 RepID=A0A5F1ZQ25_9LEPT|nr:hypothetical protein [Leptospira langatensis]TGK01804.1 hypothetical protein EHO57_08355 [Leptospira langatensis]TGL39410.1 hypothetical protein EHQ53_15115 [Leptospira langatensis]
MKENIEKRIFDYFTNSSDFNGMPLRQISEEFNIDYKLSIDILKDLIKEDKVIIQSSTNPNIISFHHYPIEAQLEVLDNARDIKIEYQNQEDITIIYENTEYPICLYPSQSKLKSDRSLSEFGYSCYSMQLAYGQPQLKPLFFDIDVLDRYYNDPRFNFDFGDYSGNISCKYDEFYNPLVRKEDNVLIKSFGIGFDDQMNRVVVVYLRYLHNLTGEHQVYWKGKERHQKCTILSEYYQSTIEGAWTSSYSIFSAFLIELKCLNELSFLIFNINLFYESFENEKKPKEFTFFFTPTTKNYYDFILLLDKMISENINKSFFNDKIDLFDIKEEKGIYIKKDKGTLVLLEEWLTSMFVIEEDGSIAEIILPLKKVRKERQIPAHKINENYYDLALIEKQKEIISDVYNSMRQLRHIFYLHPKAKRYILPKSMEEAKIISI